MAASFVPHCTAGPCIGVRGNGLGYIELGKFEIFIGLCDGTDIPMGRTLD